MFAVDIQPEMLDLLRTNLAKENITNVTPVLGTSTDAKLQPATVDFLDTIVKPGEMALAIEELRLARQRSCLPRALPPSRWQTWPTPWPRSRAPT